MSLSRTRVIAPLWLLLVAAVLLAGAVVARSQLMAPAQQPVLLRVPAALQTDTAPTETQSRSASERGASDPAPQQQADQPVPVSVTSQALLEAKGAQRQPPASQTCGATALEVCPDQ